MDAHGVSRLELRNTVAQLGAFDVLDDLAHKKVARGPGGMVASS
jgi:hypothetical protein